MQPPLIRIGTQYANIFMLQNTLSVHTIFSEKLIQKSILLDEVYNEICKTVAQMLTNRIVLHSMVLSKFEKVMRF